MLKGPLLHPAGTKMYLADQSHRIVSPASQRLYRLMLGQLQAAHPGKRVEEFTEDDLMDFVKTGEVASATRGKRKQVLTGFFEWAYWRELVVRNPAAGLKMRLQIKVKPSVTHRWLSSAERQAMLTACGGGLRGKRDRLILLLGLLCGLRRSEIAALRWANVDLHAKTLTFMGKGQKLAVLGIPTQLAQELFTWRSELALGLARPVVDTDPVLIRFRLKVMSFRQDPDAPKGTGERESVVQPEWNLALGDKGVAMVVRAASANARIGHVAPHDLRRTFAGMLEEQGKSIQDISRAMRHDNIGTTDRYLSRNPRRTIAVTEDLVV